MCLACNGGGGRRRGRHTLGQVGARHSDTDTIEHCYLDRLMATEDEEYLFLSAQKGNCKACTANQHTSPDEP